MIVLCGASWWKFSLLFYTCQCFSIAADGGVKTKYAFITVARKSSIGGLCVCAGGLTFKFDKNSTNS